MPFGRGSGHYENTMTKVVYTLLAAIVLILIVQSLGLLALVPDSCIHRLADVGNILSGVGALGSCAFSFLSICVLLWTLKVQKNELKAVKQNNQQERFEANLFRNLDNLRQIVENFSFSIKEYDDHCVGTLHTYRCQNGLKKVYSTINQIKSILLSGKDFLFDSRIEDRYDDKLQGLHQHYDNLQRFPQSPDGEDLDEINHEIKKITEDMNLCYLNSIFKVTDYRTSADGVDIKNTAISIFIEKMPQVLFSYVRTLTQISNMFEKKYNDWRFSKKQQRHYMNQVKSQLSPEEYSLIKLLTSKYPKLCIFVRK